MSPILPYRTLDERYQTRTLPNAAGTATPTFTVPGGEWWLPLLLYYRIVTDATVANRFPFVDLLDAGGALRYRVSVATAVAASSTQDHSYLDVGFVPASFQNGTQIQPFPRLWLAPGWQVRITTTNGVAGDTLSGIALYVETLMTGPERGPRSNLPEQDVPGEFYLPPVSL